MKSKRILVLLSAYNGEKYISAQIESILHQKTEHQVDLLIRDDGSNDDTLNILQEYEMKYSDRIKVVEGENIGYNKSFFWLIQEANGYDYYSLSDQDDVWLDNKLDIAVKYLEQEDSKIPLLYASTSYLVHDDLIPFGTTQKKKREITFYNTIIQNFLPGHEQVMNQALLDELKKPIDDTKIYVYDSWITNVAMVKGKIIFNNDSFVYYRQHQNNEVGFGEGKIGWFKERVKRIRNNDNKKYAMQIVYFYNRYREILSIDQNKELYQFIHSQNNFFLRLRYVIFSRLYRQRKVETFLFKILYLLNGYKATNKKGERNG